MKKFTYSSKVKIFDCVIHSNVKVSQIKARMILTSLLEGKEINRQLDRYHDELTNEGKMINNSDLPCPVQIFNGGYND